ncbi:MAG: ATP-grasp domain-containing protein [Dehalococcoidia bacterium]|nr:ATP-grasp domain-containing protein [Dehalococcoidia bacterium]
MQAAERLGIEVVVGSEREQALAALVPGRTLALNLASPEEGARAIERFARQYPLDSIVAVDDAGTLVAALASARLGLPHNPFAAVEATRNKALLRRRLAFGELLSPPYRVLSVHDDPRAAAATLDYPLDYPVVLKPLALSGSRGVMRADGPAGFVAAFERLRALLAEPDVAADCGPTAGQLLVEGYIPGDEVSVEGLLTGGRLRVLALFDKPDPLVGPFFEEAIYVTPSRHPQAAQDAVVAATERAAHALGLRDGPLHAELRLNAEGAWPIDLAARSIGGLCSRTLSFGAGMSLEELLLRHATGAPVPSYERAGAASGVMMIPIPRVGTLRAVRGLEAARAVPRVTEVAITIRNGQRVVPLPEGSEYLGFIFARADAPAEAEAALRAAHAMLAFEIE